MKLNVLFALLGLIGLTAAIANCFESDSALARESRTSCYGNGQAKERTQFVGGKRHGDTTRWYPDGSLRAEGRFEHGKMVGSWTWNTPEGQVDTERSGVYEQGELVHR